MKEQTGAPDPSAFIGRLADDDPCFREAAAWSLGCIGHPRAARPLAGLFLRELESIERDGVIAHPDVVLASVDSLRRLESHSTLYALVKGLCVIGRCERVQEDVVAAIVDCIAEVGGPQAVREAADRVVRCECGCVRFEEGYHMVTRVLFQRLSLCGDKARKTLERLARCGTATVQPLAAEMLATM